MFYLCIGVVPTFQKTHFHRTYSAYGRIFVVMAIVWGLMIDKKRPYGYEIIGGIIVLIGASIISHAPR